MAKLDPITVSALKMLRLDTDRVPRNHNDLAFAARRRTKFKVWTQEQTDAYRHLWDRIGQQQEQQAALLRAMRLRRRFGTVIDSVQLYRINDT